MGARASLIQKMVSVLLISAFIFFVIPHFSATSFFATMIIVASVLVISWSMGQFLSGEHEWSVLLPAAAFVAADIAIFYIFPKAFGVT